ncbi:hypothetical protein R3I93_020816 [Phoxinus phoxinus]|uniref:Uncharacterized protein n=2 Tax=Phoxinus phoxinus TaxID=58324 RepID=A0AAN9C936_9TELE
MSTGPQDSSMEQLRLKRGEHTSYQIFPEPSERMTGPAARPKERLPSIVVEPSGEHRSREEDDPIHDPCDPCDPHDPAGSAQPHVDGAPRCKRASIPSIQIDSRLTPPPSPTSSRVAPPCFPG